MNSVNGANFFEKDVKEVMDLVGQVTQRRTLPRQQSVAEGRIERFFDRIALKENFLFKLICWLSALLLILGLVAYVLKSEIFKNLAIAVYGLILLIWVFVVIAVISAGVPKIHRFLKAPYQPFLDSVDHALADNMQLLRKLHDRNIEARKTVLAHYQNERNNMERRGAAISGSIDRLGLFPALAAVAVLFFGIPAMEDDRRFFLYMIISVIPFFHMMNFSAVGMYQKMDSVITVLKLSIELAGKELNFSGENDTIES